MTEKNGSAARHEPIASAGKTEFIVTRKSRYADGPPVQVMMHHREMPDERARFALACIERWGMISCQTDGEDTAGRQKVRLMTSDEIVSRACEVSELAFEAFQRRGWLAEIPSYADLVDSVKDHENAND